MPSARKATMLRRASPDRARPGVSSMVLRSTMEASTMSRMGAMLVDIGVGSLWLWSAVRAICEGGG